MNRSSQSGFTLLEMMIVISLISLTLMFAIPRFQSGYPESEFSRSAQKISNVIRLTRNAAMTTQKNHTLVVDLDHRRYWTVSEGMTEEAVRNMSVHGKPIPDAIEGMRVTYADKTTVTSGIAPLPFYKQGYSGMAWIHLTNKLSAPITILVEPFLGFPRYVPDRVRIEN